MAEIERRKEMKKALRNVVLLGVVFCVAVLVFPSFVRAEEAEEVAQELINSGVDADVVETLLNTPGETLGQRTQTMLDNGVINKEQYDKLYNSIMALPEDKRQAMKNAYDQGYGEKVYDKLKGAVGEKLDDGSIRDHVKDLKQEGYTKEQIVEMLGKEGVSTDHLKDIGYELSEGSLRDHVNDLKEEGLSRDEIKDRFNKEGINAEHLKDLGFGSEGSRPEHAKDIRDMDTEEAQHKVDRAHEKLQDKKDPANRVGHIKDKENLRGRAKDSRDVRKKERIKNEAHETRGTGAGGAKAKARRGR